MLCSATEGVVTRRGREIVLGRKKKKPREFQPCWKKRSGQRELTDDMLERKEMIKSVPPLV